ncbi:MAG: Gfo/Idh/MocA family oxidoreductase, partial [Anaerolineales bacterium]
MTPSAGPSGEVKVCVVGAGRAGAVHAMNFRRRVPRARLVAIVDVDEARAAQAAREMDLSEASFPTLAAAIRETRPDAVVITTPTPTHLEVAEEAVRAGLHILCEKPMALTLDECDRMLGAARSARVILQIGFMRRFDPAFAAAMQQIRDGVIGRPLIVRTLTRGPGLPPLWACDPRTSNGLLAEVNSHDFDT